MEKLIEVLNSVKPGVDYKSCDDFIAERVLTSLEMIMLVGKLNDAFDIEISAEDLRPENFKNLNTILDLITRLKKA